MPYFTGLLFIVNRSKKVTPTLEQMSTSSSFMGQLNCGGVDPGVPYTILAGNVAEFEEESDMIVAKLLSKVGRGAALEKLFGTQIHDMAVSRESICNIPHNRAPAPVKINVSCHHLNYFDSSAGLSALASIKFDT